MAVSQRGGRALLDVWSRLWFPLRVRSNWEECFPELVRAVQGVDEVHDRLARIGLGSHGEYGFALAGATHCPLTA